jgi:YVTN family beta-propeller protein
MTRPFFRALRALLVLLGAAAALAVPAGAEAARAYVSLEDEGTVAVIDTVRLEKIVSIAVGKRPRGLALSRDAARLYVAVSGLPKCPPPISEEQCARLPREPQADGVAVIDTAALQRTAVLAVGPDPERVELSRDGRVLFVTNEDAARLTLVDTERARILGSTAVGREPEGVRVSPDGRLVLVTSETDNSVAVVDTRTRKVRRTVAVGQRPRDLAFTPDGRTAYVSGEADASVYRIALPAGEPVRFLQLRREARPMGVALDAARARLYVSTGHGGTVAVISLEDGKLLREVAVGGRPWGLALTGDGRRLVTANGPAGDVTILDTDTLEVIGRVAAGKGPWGVVLGP